MARPLFILDTGGGGALRARVDASGCIVLPPRSQGAFIVPQGTDLSTLTDEQLAAALYETGDSPICDLGGGEYDVYVLQAPRQSDIPAITLVSSAVIGPYEVGDLPTDAYTPGTYASSAGTIASVGAAWTVNGVAWDEVTALAEGDSVTLVETPVDDSSPPNSRTFNYGPVTVAAAPPFTLPSITSFSVGPQDGGDLPVSVNIVEGSDPPQDLFIVAVPDGAGAPSVAQIAAGQDSTGAPAPAAVSVTGVASGNVNLDIDPTPADGTYDFYPVVVDSEGRFSNVMPALGVAWAAPPSDPASIFTGGEQGAWYSATEPEGIFIDTDGTTPADFGNSVARVDDQSPNGNIAVQSSTALRPLLGRAPVGAALGGPIDQGSGPAFIRFDRSDDVLPTSFPDGLTGELFVATRSGMAAYGISIPSSGSLTIGPNLPGGDVVGWLAVDRSISAAERAMLTEYHAERGGGDFGSVTDFAAFWRSWGFITEFPVVDTSAGTAFNSTWRDCSSLIGFPQVDVSKGTNFAFTWSGCSSLIGFPQVDVSSGGNFRNTWSSCSSLIGFPQLDMSSGWTFQNTWSGCSSLIGFPQVDVSSGENFQGTWNSCSSLIEFPANMFDSVTATNFSSAFLSTNLSQQSIDNVLVSINAAGTSNGTFDQSGGSAPSAAGEAAIDAMRSRGWTVTVTGGY